MSKNRQLDKCDDDNDDSSDNDDGSNDKDDDDSDDDYTTSTETLPGGSTRSDYISGVGVGKVGTYGTLQSTGGNGAIVLTFIPKTATPSFSPTTAQPTYAPSFSPTTAQPTYAPSFSPTTAQPSYAPSFSPTTAQPISLPDRPTYQVPICRDGSTLHCSCQWTLPEEQEHVFLEDSPVSNDVYQPESLDTVLPSLCSEINYQLLIIVAAVGGFVTGITLMYFFTRASKEKHVYPNRTEYTPIMEHE
jgi:hypothetical protein